MQIFVTVVLLAGSVAADLFTSMAHMEALLEAEKDLPGMIKSYITMEKARLRNLKQSV